jgi:hypothetical protein
MEFDCVTIIGETLYDVPNIRVLGDPPTAALVILKEYVAIRFSLYNAKMTAVLPDSIACLASKEQTFNLYDDKSIRHIKQFVEDVALIVERQMNSHGVGTLTQEDTKVIVDLFLERLPMVWQDAGEEIKKGRKLTTVMKEMKDGHVIRILGRLGYDIESWLKEFEEFYA